MIVHVHEVNLLKYKVQWSPTSLIIPSLPPSPLPTPLSPSLPRYLDNNDLSGSIPTQLGQLVDMTKCFYLHENELSSSIPTQLGQLINMEQFFLLKENNLCSEVPTEVQALSSGVTHWGVTTGNSIGTVRK